MAECEKMATCTFINTQLTVMPGMAEMFKKRYCQDNCSECVRYKLEKHGIVVPPTLFPDDDKTAETMLPKAG